MNIRVKDYANNIYFEDKIPLKNILIEPSKKMEDYKKVIRGKFIINKGGQHIDKTAFNKTRILAG